MAPHVLCVGGEDHGLRLPFLEALRERGFRVTAASPSDGTAFVRQGIHHESFGFDRFAVNGAGDWAAAGRLSQLIGRVRPDLVQTFDTKPNLLAPLASRGTLPVVRSINGLGWVFSSRGPRALALRPIYCSLQRMAAEWSAVTVFQNSDDKAFFERWRLLGRSRGCLIRSSGIDTAAFEMARAAAPAASLLRRELGLEGDEVVMTVGRLTRQKGIPTLLDAVPLILRERPNARFVLVGPRDSEGPFAVGAADLERYGSRIVALGPRADVPALLGIANIFACPTEYREGVPRVLLEAGLAGLPIVASRMPGCTDVVKDGWNGYLVSPGNAEAMAARIIDLLGQPEDARTMGARSQAFVRENFSLGNVADLYAALYRQLTAEAAARRSRGSVVPLMDEAVSPLTRVSK